MSQRKKTGKMSISGRFLTIFDENVTKMKFFMFELEKCAIHGFPLILGYRIHFWHQFFILTVFYPSLDDFLVKNGSIMINLYKITISTPWVVREVSKHRFSGSRNLSVSLNFMCDKWKTLLSTLWPSGIMPNPIKWT